MRPRLARVILVFVVTGCASDGPAIDVISPAEGPTGAVVTIEGARFCGASPVLDGGGCETLPTGSVSFGIDPQVSAEITAWQDDRIVVIVPDAAAPGDVTVVVTVDGRSSNGVSFRVR